MADWPSQPTKQGKARDIYDLGDRIVLVATDRISAFDWVLPTLIPDKGRVLTALSAFWFGRLGVPHHLTSVDLAASGIPVPEDQQAYLEGRAMVVRPANVVPVECVARGYLSGSGWREYRRDGQVCGVALPTGLKESDRLPEPIFTPATKAETGHDENITFDQMADSVGRELAETLRDRTLAIYRDAAEFALERGLILADTKFEWGFDRRTGELMLIDEALTPDSSRYWSMASYKPGRPQPSFDKQFVRDWLDQTTWNKASPPPPLPSDVVKHTREKYIQAYEILTGSRFPW